jgi:rhamnulose-1-phosphate aldolase
MARSNTNNLAAFVFGKIPEIGFILNRLAIAAAVIHQQGWAEANAGNVSYRIGDIITPYLNREGWFVEAKDWYLVSRSGSRYRDMAKNPEPSLMLVATSSTDAYFPADAVPTSEWGCHKLVHESDEQALFPCLLHTHPTEVIALSHTKLFADETGLNKRLSALLPELVLYLPKGIATSAYKAPGSVELAEETCRRFGDKQALIWEKHGLLCRGNGIDQALDYLEIVNKAAKLNFLV